MRNPASAPFSMNLPFCTEGAGGPILDFTGGGIVVAAEVPLTAGWAFSFSDFDLDVTALGFFDAGSDGLRISHQVGLWDSGGSLLAQVTVDNTSTPVASTSTAGQWLFTELPSPITLPRGGTYILGAFIPDLTDGIYDGANPTTASGITFLGERIGLGGFVFPKDAFPQANQIFGPNLLTCIRSPE
jgi:hypothetical protein